MNETNDVMRVLKINYSENGFLNSHFFVVNFVYLLNKVKAI